MKNYRVYLRCSPSGAYVPFGSFDRYLDAVCAGGKAKAAFVVMDFDGLIVLDTQ